MKSPSLPQVLAVLGFVAIITGCSTGTVIPIGKDSYMVNAGGWPAMNGFACESKSYQKANQYCATHGLAISSSQATTIDGKVFCHNASCKLVFTTTNLVVAP